MVNNIVLNIKEINNLETKKQYDFNTNNNINIPIQIIYELLNSNQEIEKILNILSNNNIKNINIYLENETNPILVINKISLLNSLLEYIKEKNINSEITKKIIDISYKMSYENILKNNHVYEIKIDNEIISIPVYYFYYFLNLSDDIYNLYINNKIKDYKGIKIETFIYSLNNYLEDNNYLNNYLFPTKIINRYLELRSLQLIDYESINKIQKTKDPYLKDVKLNKKLEDLLFNEKESNKLEYIINTYIKLCNMFTYDDLYYIDPISIEGMKHTKIEYLKEIGIDNNKIVCFEFTAIFGYFLNKLGIKYEVIQNKSEYGFLHNSLVFKYEKYLISINPIISVLQSDLTNAKIGSSLLGIYSINKNKNTVLEFEKVLEKCYKTKTLGIENEYLPANKINNNNNISLSPKIKLYLEKLDLVLKKIKQMDLEIIDKIAYFKILMKLVFTNNELQINVSECIVIDNSTKKLILIITLNEFSYMNLDNYYLIYDNNTLKFIEKEQLQELFYNLTYEYLNEKHIPGIKEKKIK